MNHYFQNIPGWFTYPKFYSTLVQHAQDGFHFVEIGSWKGTSAAFMGVEIINSGKKVKFDCIDTWEGSEEHLNPKSSCYEPLLETKDGPFNVFLENIKPVRSVINIIRKTSAEASCMYQDNSLELVFIDAAHDYNNVCLDINAWLPKLKYNGILAGHDISFADVEKAVNLILKNYLTPGEDIWVYRKR